MPVNIDDLFDVVNKIKQGSQLSSEEMIFMSDFRKQTVPNSYTVRGNGSYEDEPADYGNMLDPFIDWWVTSRL